MSDQVLMRIHDVLEMMNVSKSTIYRMIRDKQFPKPLKKRGCSCWPRTKVLSVTKGDFRERE